MLQIVLKPVGGKFPLDPVTGAAHAGALRIAALDHKAGNYPVKDRSIIKSLFHQGNKIGHRIRRGLRVQLHLHHAAVFHLNRHYWVVFHCAFSLFLFFSALRRLPAALLPESSRLPSLRRARAEPAPPSGAHPHGRRLLRRPASPPGREVLLF